MGNIFDRHVTNMTTVGVKKKMPVRDGQVQWSGNERKGCTLRVGELRWTRKRNSPRGEGLKNPNSKPRKGKKVWKEGGSTITTLHGPAVDNAHSHSENTKIYVEEMDEGNNGHFNYKSD